MRNVPWCILLSMSFLSMLYLSSFSFLDRWVYYVPQQQLRGGSITHERVASKDQGNASLLAYEITTTNYGWNTPADLNFSRRVVTGEFFNATKAHPRYNASAWADLEAHPDPNRTLVVFLDVDTCLEFLYPIYVTRTWWVNAEGTDLGRTSGGGYMDPLRQSCHYISRAATSPALTANPNSRLVVLNCIAFDNTNLKHICGHANQTFVQEIIKKNNSQVVFASYSERISRARKNLDLGLPPPAVKPVSLKEEDRQAIKTCNKRRYLFSFQGRGGHGREGLLNAAVNNTDFFVRIELPNKYTQDRTKPSSDTLNYKELLLNSTFGGTPKGDALYSYRFSETMSAGTIPVVYADDWLPPFNSQVIRWEDAAVFIQEKDMQKTADILRAIPPERVCQMQNYVLHIWDTYISDRAGWVRGLTKAALAQSNIMITE
jgi:Exostosin family